MADFFGKLKSGAGKVAFEADKMTRVNKAQGELNQFKRQMEAFYLKLGEMYYRDHMGQAIDNPAYAEICQSLVGLEQQISAKNEEVKRINAEVFQGQGQQPAVQQPMQPVSSAPFPGPAPVQPQAPDMPGMTPPSPVNTEKPAQADSKICPNCGRQMAAAVKFCPDCGTKMA